MSSILVYSDSLSWGIIPPTRKRLSEKYRWPCVMESVLSETDKACRVIENCLNGRRTVSDDPIKAGRNGSVGLPQIIEAQSPLSLVIIMLGTNDFQAMHNFTVANSAQGVAQIINAIRTAEVEPGMQIPEIMIMAPPIIQKPMGPMAQKFKGAEIKSQGLGAALQAVAESNHCYFFNVAEVTGASRMDGVHLDSDQHVKLGRAMGDFVYNVLCNDPLNKVSISLENK